MRTESEPCQQTPNADRRSACFSRRYCLRSEVETQQQKLSPMPHTIPRSSKGFCATGKLTCSTVALRQHTSLCSGGSVPFGQDATILDSFTIQGFGNDGEARTRAIKAACDATGCSVFFSTIREQTDWERQFDPDDLSGMTAEEREIKFDMTSLYRTPSPIYEEVTNYKYGVIYNLQGGGCLPMEQ
jgi:hypothetical protein